MALLIKWNWREYSKYKVLEFQFRALVKWNLEHQCLNSGVLVIVRVGTGSGALHSTRSTSPIGVEYVSSWTHFPLSISPRPCSLLSPLTSPLTALYSSSLVSLNQQWQNPRRWRWRTLNEDGTVDPQITDWDLFWVFFPEHSLEFEIPVYLIPN